MDEPQVHLLGVPVASLVATVALIALQLCGDPPPRAGAPAIAAAADRYTVAWMRPARHGGALLVQQFARDTLRPLGPPHAVVDGKDLRAGGVELVAVDSGYIATSRVEDPNKKTPWSPTDMLALALDRDGNRLGNSYTFGPISYACHGAGEIDGRVIMAYEWVARSRRQPNDLLGVLVLDRNARYQGERVIAANPIACASAVRGREIAVVWTRWVETGSAEHSVGLRIAFEDPFRGGRNEKFVVPVGSVAVGPVRVAPHGDDWAVLYSDEDTYLHLAFVDTRGTLLGTRELPRGVDRDTVDLASNARGIFVTWVDGSRVHFLAIDGSPRAPKTAGSRASETRAFGEVASCVAAWTVDRGKRARIARYADCP